MSALKIQYIYVASGNACTAHFKEPLIPASLLHCIEQGVFTIPGREKYIVTAMLVRYS